MAGVKKLKATPTEYRGVLYRSKSEAMFARYLELEGTDGSSIGEFCARKDGLMVTNCGFGFQYEPTTFIKGWNPDFLVWNVRVPNASGIDKQWFCHSIAIMNMTFIEYKPSKPTEAYCARFLSGAQKWVNRFADDHHEARRTSFEIYYGSPYEYEDKPCGVIRFEDDYWSEIVDFDWLGCWIDAILDYRYDLKHGGNNV